MSKTIEEIERELGSINYESQELDSRTLAKIKNKEIDPLSKLCEIYCPLRSILKLASNLPGKVGRAIKSLLSILDVICDCSD